MMNKFLLILTFLMGVFVQINAQTVTWLGGAGNWTDPTKWDTGAVPTAGEEALIDENTSIVSFSGTTTVGKVNVRNDAQLTIEAGSELTITSTVDRALETSPSGIITNDGTINISTTGGEGLYNKGPFVNNGSIIVDGTWTSGIRLSSGTFTNSSTGTISVTNVGQSAPSTPSADHIYVDDSGAVPSTFENNGSVIIVVITGDDGIYVNDNSIFNNAGTVNISLDAGATEGDEGIYAEDGGTFNNNSGGVVTISSSKDHGMAATTGGVLNNDLGGIINIDAVTDDQIFLDNAATASNAGVINLTNASDIALYVTDSSIFTNETTGEINVTNATDHSVYVDANGNSSPATFTNSGTITVNGGASASDGLRIGEGGVLVNNSGGVLMYNTAGDEAIEIDFPGTLTNNGTINIPGSGDHGIENAGTITNGGTITIGAVTDDQLFLDATSTVSNSGTINLTNGSDVGLFITDASVFTNTATGEVNVTDAGDNNIFIDANSNATPATLDNFGNITSTGGTAGFDGLRMQEGGIVNNNAGGSLFFVSNIDEGIQVDATTTFNNSGTVDITTSGDHGMELFGTFNNMDGGLYKSTDAGDDGMALTSASVFANDGSISIDGSVAEDIEVNGATFTHTANAKIIPGSSPGDMIIKDPIDLGEATLVIEINGLTAVTEHDQIKHANGADLFDITSAKLELDWGSYIPAVNDEFVIIDKGTSATLGPFASITSSNTAIEYTVNYTTSNDVIIEITAILPVELTNFEGKTQSTTNTLSWQTQTEEGNDYFEVQHSTNGREFTTLDKVAGNGTTAEVQNYDYTHKNVRSSDNYYRLKQVDFDGEFAYSDIIYLQNDTRGDAPVAIYPNPAQEALTYEGAAASLTFFDINGRQVLRQTTGEERTTIDISSLNSGVYTIEILNDANQKVFKKLIKQ